MTYQDAQGHRGVPNYAEEEVLHATRRFIDEVAPSGLPLVRKAAQPGSLSNGDRPLGGISTDGQLWFSHRARSCNEGEFLPLWFDMGPDQVGKVEVVK